MGTYILVLRASPERMGTVERLHELDELVRTQVAAHHPAVRWVASYALLGPYDCLDIFEAPDDATAKQVVAIVQSFGYVTTDLWTAVPRERLRRPGARGPSRPDSRSGGRGR